VAVIGYSVAVPDPDGKPLVEVGDRIKLTADVNAEEKVLTVRVVGILEEAGGAFGSDSEFFIPLKTVEQFFKTNGKYDTIQVLVEDSDLVEAVAYNIEDEIDGVTAMTAASAIDMIGSTTGTIEAVLGGVARAMVIGFAVVTSVVSGLYPSWSASQLSPVEALRHE
jgi:ABC-type lipoprotein release transport system permease subunit